jgi:inner membrane transporter RhtA
VIPAPALFVVGGLSMYVGAALAVGLFDRSRRRRSRCCG